MAGIIGRSSAWLTVDATTANRTPCTGTLSGPGSGGSWSRLGRDHAELAHQRQVVAHAPMLDRLAISIADDMDVVVGDLSTGRWQTREVAGVPTMVGAA